MQLALDDLSVILLGLVLALLVLHIFLRPPSPQAHPILLGKQGDASTVRNAGESAVWRSNQSMGRMIMMRPAPAVKSVADLVVEPDLLKAAKELAAGLQELVKPGRVAIYTEDYQAAFTLVAAVSLLNNYSVLLVPEGISSARIAKALADVSAILVSPKTLKETGAGLPSESKVISPDATEPSLISFEALKEAGLGKTLVKSREADLRDVFGRVLLANHIDGVDELELTQGNLTAAAYTFTTLLPMAGRLFANDRVLSFFNPAEPFGLGLAFSMASAGVKLELASAAFGGVDVLRASKASKPTLVFAPSSIAVSLSEILSELATSTCPIPWLVPRAYASKLARLRAGYVGPHTLWEFLVYKPVRQDAGLDNLRAVALFSSPASEALHPIVLDRLRISLSCPVLAGYAHPACAAPIFATHPYDLQAQNGPVAHSGPPAPNAACKVVVDGGETSASADGKVAMTGQLMLSSPSVLRPVQQSSRWQERRHTGIDDGDSWFETGTKVDVRPNGTFVVLS